MWLVGRVRLVSPVWLTISLCGRSGPWCVAARSVRVCWAHCGWPGPRCVASFVWLVGHVWLAVPVWLTRSGVCVACRPCVVGQASVRLVNNAWQARAVCGWWHVWIAMPVRGRWATREWRSLYGFPMLVRCDAGMGNIYAHTLGHMLLVAAHTN